MAPSLEVDDAERETFLTEYQNPIIPGFAPDPSVVLVDGVYYLATSSFHIFPGIPIYASTDLKTWTHISLSHHRQYLPYSSLTTNLQAMPSLARARSTSRRP